MKLVSTSWPISGNLSLTRIHLLGSFMGIRLYTNYYEELKKIIIVKDEQDSILYLPDNFDENDVLAIKGMNQGFVIKIKSGQVILMQDYCTRRSVQILIGKADLYSPSKNDALYLAYRGNSRWVGEWGKNCY